MYKYIIQAKLTKIAEFVQSNSASVALQLIDSEIIDNFLDNMK